MKGHGTRGNGRARFLPSPKRQRLATGDWRLVEWQRMANGFLEGNAPALPRNLVTLDSSVLGLSPKISVMQEHDPPVKNFSNAE